MAKIYVNQKLQCFDKDEALADADGPIGLSRVLINALFASAPGDNTTGEKKFKLYLLAQRIKEAAGASGSCDLLAEDISLLKEQVGKLYPPLIVGQVFNMLEGAQSG